MKKIDKKIALIKKQQAELIKRAELEDKAFELILQHKFEEAQGVMKFTNNGILERFKKELDALEKEGRQEPSDNIPDEPMELGLESIGDKNFLLLDGKRIHHVRKYVIKNEYGYAELSIKMMVKFESASVNIGHEKSRMEEMNLNSAASKENKGSVIFISDAHEKFYRENMKKVRNRDEYHEALIYCLGICNDTRKNIDRIYDFETGCVKPECLREGWQTSGSMKVVRMAFNLYCDDAPSVYQYENTEERMSEYRQYTPEKIFCCAYAPYFWQAIQLLYPDYATYNHSLYAAFGSAD